MSRDLLPEEPCEPEPEPAEPDEASDLDFADMPCTDGDDGDDSRWEAFVPDEDESDPEPDPGDFWIDGDCGLRIADCGFGVQIRNPKSKIRNSLRQAFIVAILNCTV